MCDLWWTEWHWDRFLSEFFGFPLSASLHRGSPYSCITWGMNNRPVSGRSSDTEARSPAKAKDFSCRLCPDQLWGPSSLWVTRSIPGGKARWGVTLSTHPHLVPRSRMSRSYNSSPPWHLHDSSGTYFTLLQWGVVIYKIRLTSVWYWNPNLQLSIYDEDNRWWVNVWR
jgi:hypothetical protein